MISDVHRLFQVAKLTKTKLRQENLFYKLTESCLQLPQFWRRPESHSEERGGRPFLEEQEETWRKLQHGTQLLMKEARERSRGWEEHPAPEDVELAFKKVNRKFYI